MTKTRPAPCHHEWVFKEEGPKGSGYYYEICTKGCGTTRKVYV